MTALPVRSQTPDTKYPVREVVDFARSWLEKGSELASPLVLQPEDIDEIQRSPAVNGFDRLSLVNLKRRLRDAAHSTSPSVPQHPRVLNEIFDNVDVPRSPSIVRAALPGHDLGRYFPAMTGRDHRLHSCLCQQRADTRWFFDTTGEDSPSPATTARKPSKPKPKQPKQPIPRPPPLSATQSNLQEDDWDFATDDEGRPQLASRSAGRSTSAKVPDAATCLSPLQSLFEVATSDLRHEREEGDGPSPSEGGAAAMSPVIILRSFAAEASALDALDTDSASSADEAEWDLEPALDEPAPYSPFLARVMVLKSIHADFDVIDFLDSASVVSDDTWDSEWTFDVEVDESISGTPAAAASLSGTALICEPPHSLADIIERINSLPVEVKDEKEDPFSPHQFELFEEAEGLRTAFSPMMRLFRLWTSSDDDTLFNEDSDLDHAI